MLKPNQKILRKEIKKDPLLDTFEKIESGYKKNRKTLLNTLFFFVVIVFGGSILINNQKKTELESNSALGAALVSYSILDYSNAKYQLESIVSTYGGTESEIFANYFLGKIAYEQNDFNRAVKFLNYFLDNSNSSLLVCGAVKQLVDISSKNNNFLKSLEYLEHAKTFNLNEISVLELNLLEIAVLVELNDLKNAREKIDKISINENTPAHLKQKIDEFAGIL